MTELPSVKFCWNGMKWNHFWSELLQAMKNGWNTRISNASAHGQGLMTLHKRFLSLDWRKTRYCRVCGGIGKELSTMSCCKVAKPSIRSCTVHNSTVWTKQSRKSVHNWPTERESCSIMTMRGHTHLWWTNWRNLDGKFWCIHRIARILHHRTTICFALCKTRLMGKNWPTETLLKHTWASFSTINHRNSTPMKLWSYLKNCKRS